MEHPHHRHYTSAPAHPHDAAAAAARARARLRRRLAWAMFLPLLGFSIYKGGGYILNKLSPPDEDIYRRKVVANPIKDAEWATMISSLENLAYNYSGHVGIYIKDLNSDRVWEYNPDRLFPSASLIKVPIMVAICEKIKRSELSLDTQIKLTRRDRIGGSGSLKWVREGTSLSVMEIIYKMITESDNTATKMLIDYAGIEYFQQAFAAIGLVYTKIYPEGLSLTSGPVAKENYTTAREMAVLMERIYKGEMVDRNLSEFMLDVLKHNKSRSRLRKGLPLGWEIGHKTGLLRKSCHDVGIVFSPRGDYIIAVLTSEVPNYSSAKGFISRVAKLTYEYYKIDADYAAAGVSRKA
ncbi:MAG: serine hydrolase [Elusimicrobiales bacterium]|jgi:beta-lactamase class A